MQKITIIGAGRVGESAAQLLAVKELAREIVLIDIREGVAAGVALDIQESATLFGFDSRLHGDTETAACAGSDLVIITAGLPRKPGMSRSDVLDANLGVIRPLVDTIMSEAPDAIIVMVTNPVDIMTYQAWRQTGWDRSRVFGLSGVLDAGRMAAFVALETGFSAKDITAMVLGGHGDAMVPLPRYSCVNGIPVTEFMDQTTIERIVQRTRDGGAEILALKQMSSANDSPAAAVVEMVDAVAHNRRRLIPCVAILDGEYGCRDIAMGVPVVIGAGGVERVIELTLTEEERAQFERSAEGVRNDIERLHG